MESLDSQANKKCWAPFILGGLNYYVLTFKLIIWYNANCVHVYLFIYIYIYIQMLTYVMAHLYNKKQALKV